MSAALSLNDIVALLVTPMFRRPDSPWATIPEPKPKVGIFGDPGSGKSVLMSACAIKDYFLYGERVWSNIKIKHTWEVPNNIARENGVAKGGEVIHQADGFNKSKMFRMKGDYRVGGFALDEINVELADSLKFNTNANFYFNQVDQQLRKDQMGLLYSSIHEMWVDSRLKQVTDIMIKCFDTALSPEGIAALKPRGEQIEFYVYPMTRYLTGRTWVENGEKLGPFYLQAKKWWGTCDTYQRQSTGKRYAQSYEQLMNGDKAGLEIGSNDMAVEEYNKWGWLYDIINGLRVAGVKTITSSNLKDLIEGETGEKIPMTQVGIQLKRMNIVQTGFSGNKYSPLTYHIPDFDIEVNPEHMKQRVLVK